MVVVGFVVGVVVFRLWLFVVVVFVVVLVALVVVLVVVVLVLGRFLVHAFLRVLLLALCVPPLGSSSIWFCWPWC